MTLQPGHATGGTGMRQRVLEALERRGMVERVPEGIPMWWPTKTGIREIASLSPETLQMLALADQLEVVRAENARLRSELYDINAWTVGDRKAYSENLREAEVKGEPLRKIGRLDLDLEKPYEGGAVFRGPTEAQEFIDTNGLPYAVYGLTLPHGWEQDVDESKEAEEGFCRLLHTAIIVKAK